MSMRAGPTWTPENSPLPSCSLGVQGTGPTGSYCALAAQACVLLPGSPKGECNLLPQNRPLGHKDCFRLTTFKKQQRQEMLKKTE